MNGPRGYYFLSEISQITTNTVCYHLYVNLKIKQTSVYNKIETDTQIQKIYSR